MNFCAKIRNKAWILVTKNREIFENLCQKSRFLLKIEPQKNLKMTNLGRQINQKFKYLVFFSVKKYPFYHQNPKWPLWKDFHQLEFLNQKWTFDTLCTDCPCSSFRTTFCILYFPMKLEFGIRRIDLTESFLSWAELEIYFSYLKLPTWTWKFSKVMKYVWPKKGLGRRQIMNFVWYLLKHRFQESKEKPQSSLLSLKTNIKTW